MRAFFNSFGISTHLSRLERNIGTHGHDSNGTRYDSHQLWNINHAGWKSRQSFLDPMLSDTDELMNTMQIDFLQPVYTLTFSNGLIACFVFMGIGTLLDVGFLLQKPFASLFLALCGELGTFLTLPIANALGLSAQESASVAMVGGADGPMVLFTSLALAKHLFVPITVVAYLYLGLTYGGYPYLVKLLIPKRFRSIKMTVKKAPKNYDAKVKLAFAAVLCAVLCFLFPVASPLFSLYF